MRLGQQAGATDAGRKRRQNEDSFVVDPPLFAVADGMGGALAGEVASRLATAALREYHEADELPPEERLAAIIQEANRRIYDRAQHDAQVSGMGTTTTAALVDANRIAIGHVGDSRAYRLRGGTLEQLTEDHSLVGDLMRSGRLTPEEARSHPQRSVITRALGTDPDVDVDTFTVEAEPGDVYLLCSDGLTSMVLDEDILRTIRKSRSLESAGKALIQAANRRGGDDNITVVLFAVDDDEASLDETAAIDRDGTGSTDDLEDTLSDLEPPPGAYADAPQPETMVVKVASHPPTPDGVTDQAGPERALAGREQEDVAGWVTADEARAAEAPPPRRWRRRLLAALVMLALVTILLALAFWGLSTAHFVGADEDGRVAVYQGVPWDLGAGTSLYRERYVSQLRAVQLSADERARLFDHDVASYETARARVARYEEEGTVQGVEGRGEVTE